MSDETITRIGDYEVLGVLGAGGMGKVYKVRNLITDRVEAMKILLPDLAGRRELAERFLREIKTLAGLTHPNIAALHTALTWNNQLVMVMECVEGVTLATRIKQGPLAPAEAVEYISQVLSALSYAHGLGVIHRDIKPPNMMLTPANLVKLMDFGIARSQSNATLTATGSTLGSLHYMSPEQVKGGPVDARSDLYSVGVSLYEMVAGRRPFEAESDYGIMAAQLQDMPVAPIAHRPDLPPALNEIIMVAMSKEPAERFQSADAFRTALQSVASSSVLPAAALPSTATSYGAGEAYGGGEATRTAVTPASASIRATLKSAERPAAASVPSQPAAPAPPTPSQAPAAAAVPVPAVAAAAATPVGHRGLYITIGAVIVLAMLVGAGLYFPGRKQAMAAPASNRGGASLAADAHQPPSAPSADTPTAGAPPATQPTAGAGPAAATSSSAPAEVHAAATRVPPAAPPLTKAKAGATSGSNAAAVTKVGGAPAAGRPPQQPQPRAALNAHAGNGPTPSPSADAAQLQQLEHDLDLLHSRVEAVNSGLDGMRQAQAAQGLGLRGDIVASQQRMKTYMAKALSAAKDQDAGGVKKYLDMAESEVELLEKFLGR